MQNKNTPFSGAATVLFLSSVVVLLSIVAGSVLLAARSSQVADDVARARVVRAAAADVLTTLLNAETGQRGFILTSRERYLVPFNQAKIVLPERITTMRNAFARDKAKLTLVERLASQANAKIAELSETVELNAAGRHNEALAIVLTDRGQAIMENARVAAQQLIAIADARVTNRLANLESNIGALKWLTVVGGIVIAVFAAGAIFIILRFTREIIQARQTLEGANERLEQRVVERTADLTQANEEIQRFAYIVSHDLRAPLVNIMGFTSELEAGTVTLKMFVAAEEPTAELKAQAVEVAEVELPEAVSFIRASTGKMDRLINAILKLSREGRRELQPDPIDLHQMLTGITNSLHHQLNETKSQISIPPEGTALVSDRLALEQVLSNLIDNAVKYLQPGRPGKISIKTEDRGGRLFLTVQDNGRGIADQDYERIFDLFRRSGVQDRPGEGIGLAHVRALVRRLGGDITVKSQLGAGTEFHINLPKILRLTAGA